MKCKCIHGNSQHICQPLCPKLEITTNGYNKNNTANCTLYETVEKTSCKCLVMKTSCQSLKGSHLEQLNFIINYASTQFICLRVNPQEKVDYDFHTQNNVYKMGYSIFYPYRGWKNFSRGSLIEKFQRGSY